MQSKLALAFAPVILLVSNSAIAQTATAVGVGTGISSSRSESGAVAISGQGGSVRGSGNSNSSLTVNSVAPPAVTTSNVVNSGTSTVKNVPAVFAPGLSAAGLETCLGSVSGGGSIVGTGLSFGTSIPDPGCAARLDARTLWSMGLKKAAVARLCLNPDIYRAMPEICGTYLPPQPGYAPVAYAPAPILLQASTEPTGGPIELIEGKTGKPRFCNDYNAPKQRCRVWAR